MTLKLLSIIHELILKGRTLTKRDIFYMDTTTFKAQINVDRLIECLSRKFQVAPINLGIVSLDNVAKIQKPFPSMR
jgi:DNA topoisomerase VI subunit A